MTTPTLPSDVSEMFCACCSDLVGTDVHIRDRCTSCTGAEVRRVIQQQHVTELQALEILNRRRHYADLGYQ